MERWTFALAILCLVWSDGGAVEVVIPQPQYEFARGDNITLPCTFKTTKVNPAVIVVTWSAEAAEVDAEENQVLSHFWPSGQTDITSKYEGRASLDVDIKRGRANLKLSSITLDDNKSFECRLLIQGDDEGTPADTTRLVVLVAPSTPICKIQGTAEYGQNINLTCRSEEGSPPPTYTWKSVDTQSMPRAPYPRSVDKGGILSLFNISKESSGYYTCTSTNKIRSAQCNITLSVMPPSMNIGSTAGIIGGVVAALIVLIVIIYCCCCRKKKEGEEEYAMGKVEDEYHDKEPNTNGGGRRADEEESVRGPDDDRVRSPVERRDDYEERSERDYDRRRDYDDRRSDYDDRRSDYTDRRERYDDDRHYDDERRYDDRRDRRYEDDDRERAPRRDYDD
ncbi:cell surface A33 antigen-like [Menidia menidia]